jgi:alcohol dehydrogenase (cytochrome c)
VVTCTVAVSVCPSRAVPVTATDNVGVTPCWAAEVTPDRLINADKEPQNWLMNHRTYDGQRFSPLARIDRSNVKNLKLAYAVPLGGTAGNESVEATSLVENGFLYITDGWGVLYKIDGTSGDVGPHRVAHGPR